MNDLATIENIAELIAFRHDEVVDALKASRVPMASPGGMSKEKLSGMVVRAAARNPVFRKKLAELMARNQAVQQYVEAGGGPEYMNAADPVSAVADFGSAITRLFSNKQDIKREKLAQTTTLVQGAVAMKLNNQATQLANAQALANSPANSPKLGGQNKNSRTAWLVVGGVILLGVIAFGIYYYYKKNKMEFGGNVDSVPEPPAPPQPPAPAPPAPETPTPVIETPAPAPVQPPAAA